MKILLVAPCFPPQQAVASLRTHAFAETWARAGHAVTVLTTAKRPDQTGLDLPRDPFRVVELPYAVPWFFERLRGRHRADEAPRSARPRRRWFQVLRRLRQRTGIFSAVRMPDLTDFWVKPARAWARADAATHGGWDVVVSSSGPYPAHLVARPLRAAGIARHWVADFRDLWTEHHLYHGLFPFTIYERLLERACLAQADRLVTVTDGLADKLTARAGKPVDVIYNGYDDAAFAALSPEPVFPSDGRTRLVYTGTLYPGGQDPIPLLRALAELCDERLVLTVAGPSGELWQQLANGHACPLDDRGLVRRDVALRLQRDAGALVLLDWHDPRQGVLTGKVFEYLKATAPILVIGGPLDSPLARLVARAGRGIALGSDPGRIKTTLAGLSALRGQPDTRFIATLSRERQSLRLLELMERSAPRQRAAA